MVKKALLIGINYRNTDYELNGCINDINNINDFLQQYCDYKKENIQVLTETSGVLPTKSNIMQKINWLVTNNVKGDTLFFYYSGHGSSSKEDVSLDETDKKDEELIPLDYNNSGQLNDDWLYQNLAAKTPKNINLWCFFDCCCSGTMLDLVYNYKSLCTYNKGILQKETVYNSRDWNTKFEFTKESSTNVTGNVFAFSGCLDKETSEDAYVESTYQGAFTYCFLKFLNNHLVTTADNKKKFSGKDIKLRNVLKEINALIDINKFNQNSQLSVGKLEDVEKFFEI